MDPGRGVVRFVAVREEDLATGGLTVQGEIEKLVAQGGESGEGERGRGRGRRTKGDGGRSRSRRREREKVEKAEEKEKEKEKEKGRPAVGVGQQQVGGEREREKEKLMGEVVRVEERPPVPKVPGEKSALDRRAEKVQKVGRRKSFLALFGR